jgi:Protein of unknown function (DUF3592)
MSQGNSNQPPTDKQRILARLVFTTFMVFGGLLTISAVLWLWTRIDYTRHSIKVTATIIKLDARMGGKGPPAYVPTFRFENAGGVVRVVKSQAGYAEGVQVGKTVRLVYNPLKEDGLLIDRFSNIYGPPLFLSLFGAVWTMVSLLGFLKISAKLPLIKKSPPERCR